jgi:hypothetical protein
MLLANVYVKNSKIYLHYEKANFGGNSEICYDIGKHLMQFLAMDIECVRDQYRKISKLFSTPGVSINRLFACSNEMDRFCPYLHFYTQALRKFCLGFRKHSRDASCLLVLFANDYRFDNYEMTHEFVEKCFVRYPRWTPGSEYANMIDALKMEEAIELAISVLMHDITIKRYRLREEIEFIIDKNINTKEFTFIQKLYLMDFHQNTYGRSLLYRYPKLTSRLTPNTDVVKMHSISSIDELIHLELISIIENELTIKKCKYCDEYFVPIGRTDIEYCTNTKYDETRPCNEIGAIRNYNKSVVSEPANKLYLKAYRRMNSKVRTKRITQLHFLEWSDEARSKRNLCKEGKISIDKFGKWLDADKDIKKKE